MDDSSLDEFLDTGTGDDSSTADETATDETPDTAEPGPAAVTAQWTPAGAACDRCGAETRRLWTEDDSAVCRSCKEW